MKLDKRALGMALGIVWGLTIFVATLWASTQGTGNTLIKLNAIYMGYGISFWGAVIGLIWGFINGYIWGWLLAKFYNNFTKNKD